MSKISFIIMGAGKGTRMKSSVSKVMHKVAGLPMINYVINAVKPLNPHTGCVVVSPDNKDEVESVIGDVSTVLQQNASGTGSAVSACKDLFTAKNNTENTVIILNGDAPLIQTDTIAHLIDTKNEVNADISILGFLADNPTGYGRIMVADDDFVDAIIEDKECNDEQRQVNLCYSGIMAVSNKLLFELVDKIDNNNAKGEYYLTDIIKIAKSQDKKITFAIADENEVMGCDSKIDLSVAEAICQYNLRMEALEQGVHMLSPETVYFSHDTKIGKDVVIEPNVVFGLGVEISNNTTIRAFSHFEKCIIGENSVVGPYARIRPETVLQGDNKIGNFVEIKKSVIGKGSKINHLSYIGDTTMGNKVNIGAGTITCNYDGYDKYKTKIGDNVFIGSNTAIIAPVNLSDDSMVGAGSVITKNVEKDQLALSRCEQNNIDNYSKEFRDLKEK